MSVNGNWPRIVPAELEDWMRDYYFATDLDLGSSGAANYSVKQLRTLCGLDFGDLDNLLLCDGQPYGADDVRQVLADRFAGGDITKVMTTSGSSEAMFLTMSTLLSSGDEVIVVEPVYQQLAEIARSLGCRIVPWPLAARTFEADLDLLDRLTSKRTKMIVANFPHNPTGTTISAAEQERLVATAASAGAYLVWDAAFEDITYGSAPLPHPTYERAITFGTVSKSYGLSGLRFGWCLAAPDILTGYARIRDYVTLHLSTLLEFVMHRIMLHADVLLADRKALATRNLALLTEWLGTRTDLEWTRPRGGVSAAIRLCGVPDVTAFCRDLAARRRVLLVPGSVFGPALGSHVRLGFAAETPVLEEGLARLGDALDEACSWRRA